MKRVFYSLIAAAALLLGFLGGKPAAAASTSPVASVAVVNYVPGYGIALWTKPGQQFTGRYLAHGSQWRVFKSTRVNGKIWYNLGGNQWIDGGFTRLTTSQGSGPTISFLNLTTPIIEGDRTLLDAPNGNIAATWGGATQLSVNDGLSTHIIGHDGYYNFNAVKQLKIGDPITIVDSNQKTKVYYVYRVASVNDQAHDLTTGQNLFSNIVNPNQGEQIVLQTCITDTTNRIVWAR